jgi:hypothetical protein
MRHQYLSVVLCVCDNTVTKPGHSLFSYYTVGDLSGLQAKQLLFYAASKNTWY